MSKLVVTGASGLLGRHLVPLLTGTAELHLVGRKVPDLPDTVIHEVDLAAGPLDDAALPGRADAVIHLAQSRRFRAFPGSAGEVMRINTASAVELAGYAVRSGARTFVYASTGGVYAPNSRPLTEESPLLSPERSNFYVATKLAAERLLATFRDHFNLIVLRPFFIYGRGQDASMLVPRLIANVRAGTPIRLVGVNGIRLNPIHAGDAAAAVKAALSLEGSHCLNVAGPEILTMREIGETIGRAMGVDPQFESVPDDDAGDLVASIDAMRRDLVSPVTAFAEGLAELLSARQPS